MLLTLKVIQVSLPLVFFSFIVLPAVIAVLVACANEESSARLPITISGTITNASGPVAGAIVQVQGTPNKTTTAQDGTFTLHGEGLGGSKVVTVTAWAEGHFFGWVNLDPKKPIWQEGGEGVTLTLKPHHDVDNPKYNWFTFEGKSGSASCGACHREYTEWQADAHSQSANNPRFISVYRGTNAQGQKGQLTQLGGDGKVLPPDPTQPDFGPGFRLDNPERAGNCATCHTPVAAKTPNQNSCAWSGCHASSTAEYAATTGKDIQGVSPVGLMGIGTEGVACEFCHVIGSVILDPQTQLPLSGMPGILSMKLYRPQDGGKLFFGPLTDVSRELSYLPMQSHSEFCAPCHYGVMGGVVSGPMDAGKITGGTLIYDSYGEWLHSPYSDPKTGKTCQDCHMPPKDTKLSVFPERGGVSRDYVTYHAHTMPGASSQALLWSAVSMTSTAAHDGQNLHVQVSVTNDKTGHGVPTDSPLRSVMLVVEALDANGEPLPLQQGPTLPAWTGNYAGQAGKAFAKILKDNWSGETPTAAYWRPVTVVEDTRLLPLATDHSTYSFDLPAGSAATVKVKLVYRRAFQKLEQQKGWHDPDQIMAETTIPVEK